MLKSLYLYRIQPIRLEMLTTGSIPQEEQAAAEHFAYLQRLTQEGTVMLAGRTLDGAPDVFGMVLFWAESEAEARALMLADPAVAQGVMRADLHPFQVSLFNAAYFTMED
ncbi:MAG TPA: YciI family protein [Anaerolineaceae bacterium]